MQQRRISDVDEKSYDKVSATFCCILVFLLVTKTRLKLENIFTTKTKTTQ